MPSSIVSEDTWDGAWSKDGKLYASDTSGLGVAPDFDSLGVPVAEYIA